MLTGVKSENTLIIGMGPAGLLAAFHHLALGHQVTIIEARHDPFTREQPILVPREFLSHIIQHLSHYAANGYTISFRHEHSGKYSFYLQHNPRSNDAVQVPEINEIDIAFINKVAQYERILPIHVIQEYLMAKIQGHGSLTILRDTTIRKVIHAAGIVIYGTNQREELVEAQFDNVILACGAQRDLLPLLLKTPNLHETPLPTARKKLMHCASMHLSYTGIISDNLRQDLQHRSRIGPVAHISKMRPNYLPILHNFGWQHQYLPLYFITANRTAHGLDLNYTGEVPEQINSAADLLLWAQAILKREYPDLDPKQLEFCRHDPRSHATFKLQPNYVANAYKQIGRLRVFIIGDALLKANFYMGHGLGNSAIGAYAVAKCFAADGSFVSSSSAENLLRVLLAEYFANDRFSDLLVHLWQNPIQYQVYATMVDKVETLSWLFDSAAKRLYPALLPPQRPSRTRHSSTNSG
jgi:2-polyprenyl-6-methoxyphenol hydroxylase-like FAD-dependent oxidoreductase